MLDALRGLVERVKRERAKTDRFHARLRELDGEILALSLDEARAEAEAALSDPTLFGCRRGHATGDARLLELAPMLRGFFEEFDSVWAVRTGEELARAVIAPSGVLQGFIRIGSDSEHAEIAARPAEEAVYLLAEDVPRGEAQWGHYSSIYHYLAYTARLGIAVRS